MRGTQRVLVATTLVACLAVATGCGRHDPYDVTTQRRAVEVPQWKVAQPTPAPGSVHLAGMAWDKVGDALLFHGGVTSGGGLSNMTWAWDGTKWSLKCPTASCTSSPGLQGAAMAQALSSNVSAILVQGCNGTTCNTAAEYPGDAYGWNGTSWITIAPPAWTHVREAAMAYDPATQQTVLSGGRQADGTVIGDIWVFKNGTWMSSCIGATCPAGLMRYGHAMAYDRVQGGFLIYGGFDLSNSLLGDTWKLVWDAGNTKYTWSQISGATQPGLRAYAVMASPSNNSTQTTILHGGLHGAAAETYEWNAATGTWTAWSVTTPSPEGRSRAVGGWDNTRNQFNLVGGVATYDSMGLADHWKTDSTHVWTQVTIGPRYGHGMASLGSGGGVYVFGGADPEPRNDLWKWDGTIWTRQAAAGPPAARAYAGVAFDETKRQLVVMGGEDPLAGTDYGDAWAWTGANWTSLCSPCAFGQLAYPAATYDKARNALLLFGGAVSAGQSRKTWKGTWTGSNYTWTDACTGACLTNGPAARMGAAMAYDTSRNVAVMFGGCSGTCSAASDIFSDTWEWNGTSWTQVSVTGPGARAFQAMAYDSRRGRVVMYGGEDAYSASDTVPEEFDGTTWTRQDGTGHPTDYRWQLAMAFDQAHGFTVIYGGTWPSPGTYSDTVTYATYGGACGPNGTCDADYPCVTGVCCSGPCPGACAACSLAAGAPVDGTCGFASVGSAGNPACANNFVCSGQSANCPASCSDDSVCASGYYCAPDATCRQQKAAGSVCDPSTDCVGTNCHACASGYCVDNVCCQTACNGTCEHCKATTGLCEPVTAGTDPDNECPDGTDPECGKNTCNGTGQCVQPGNAQSCHCGTGSGVCNGSGTCDCAQHDGGPHDGPVGDGAVSDASGQQDGAGQDGGGKKGTTSFLGCSAAPTAGASALPLFLIGLAAALRRRRD